MCVCSVHQQLVFPAMATSGPRYLHHVALTYNFILDPATAAHAIVGQAAVAARDGKTIPLVATDADVMNTVITQEWKSNIAALKFLRYMEGEHPPGFSLGPIEITCSFTRQIIVSRKIHDGTAQGMDYSWVTGAVIASNSR